MAKRKVADSRPLEDLMQKYQKQRPAIEKRLSDFSKIKDGRDEDIYAEMAFCMLTPQSKALSCWSAVEEIRKKGLLFSDDIDSIKDVLRTKVRFHNNKANYIVNNKKVFSADGTLRIKDKFAEFSSTKDVRAWLIKNVKGYGWKEASHFLRNIGYYDDIAILDRHILWNLRRYGIIEELPKSLTPKKYLEIEEAMRKFCNANKIPMSHLDLLFWAEETGEIFK